MLKNKVNLQPSCGMFVDKCHLKKIEIIITMAQQFGKTWWGEHFFAKGIGAFV